MKSFVQLMALLLVVLAAIGGIGYVAGSFTQAQLIEYASKAGLIWCIVTVVGVVISFILQQNKKTR